MTDIIIEVNNQTGIVIENNEQGPPGVGLPTAGTTGQILKKVSNADFDVAWENQASLSAALNDLTDVVLTTPQTGEVLKFDGANWVNGVDGGAGSSAWGDITGTLSNQTDLQSALNLKADATHNHDGTYEPAFVKGTAFNKNYAGSGVADATARSDHNHSGTYEPANANIQSHIGDATLHRTINDLGATATDLWSASKITSELALKSDSTHNHDGTYEPANANIQTHIGDATQHRIINDLGTAVTELWSASKISSELALKSDATHNHDGTYEPANANIQSHIGDATLHRTINDLGTAVTDLWSASKITSELALKSDSTHNHDGTYEPVITKNTAFNKNFGGTGVADTVARSDHNHTGTYEPANANIQTHIGDATLHRTINDAGSSTTELWSASKITSELAPKLENITGESVGDLSDVNVVTPAARHVLAYDGLDSWDNRLLVEADISDLGNYSVVGHTHVKADVTDFVEGDYVHTTGVESIGGDKTFSNNVVVTGNLTVNGTTTSVNSTEVNIGDNNIVLNANHTGVPTQNAGFTIERGTETDASLIWNETTDKWSAGVAGSEVEISLLGHLHAGVYEPANANIQTHIADSSVHFTQGNIDHTAIQNVGTNTHAQIDSHIADATIHRVINDAGTSATELWSANKINTELAGKASSSHTHSTYVPFQSASFSGVTAGSQILFTKAIENDGLYWYTLDVASGDAFETASYCATIKFSVSVLDGVFRLQEETVVESSLGVWTSARINLTQSGNSVVMTWSAGGGAVTSAYIKADLKSTNLSVPRA